MSERAFVVVGGGVAAGKAVETVRDEGFDGRVVVVTEEDVLPYERPPLSKGVLLGDEDPSVPVLQDQQWYANHDVDVRIATRVESLHTTAHEIGLAGGERLPYDKLLLATGARVRRIGVPGADLDGVRYLRTLSESLALLDAFGNGGRVVVVGAGWIGLETAAAARHHGCEVVVVEPEAVPLSGPLGPEMGEVFAGLHRDHGVDFRFGAAVTAIAGSGGRARGVVLGDGSELEADVIVVGIGVIPNVELADAAGLTVDGGVVADAALRTSDPDVFVAGDVAAWEHPALKSRIRVEHWANGHDGGQAAARSMLGQDVSYDVLPFFYSDQYDLGMEFSGYIGAGGYDEVVTRGDVPGREFVAYWIRDNRVIAGMNVNVWDVQDDIQALIRSAAPPSQIS